MDKQILAKLLNDPTALQVYAWICTNECDGLVTCVKSQVAKELKINRFTIQSAFKRLESHHTIITQLSHKDTVEIRLLEQLKQPIEKDAVTQSSHNCHTTEIEKESNKERDYILANSSLRSELSNGLSDQKAEKVRENKSDKVITGLIASFTQVQGIPPTDKKPRNVGHNIRQKTRTFIKSQGPIFLQLRGLELTEEYLYERLWPWVKRLDYVEHIEKLETVKLKMPIFFTKIAQQLQKEAHDKNIQPTEAGETAGKTENSGSNDPFKQDLSAIPPVLRTQPATTGLNTEGLRGVLPEMQGINNWGFVSVYENGHESRGLGSSQGNARGSKADQQGSKLVN